MVCINSIISFKIQFMSISFPLESQTLGTSVRKLAQIQPTSVEMEHNLMV